MESAIEALGLPVYLSVNEKETFHHFIEDYTRSTIPIPVPKRQFTPAEQLKAVYNDQYIMNYISKQRPDGENDAARIEALDHAQQTMIAQIQSMNIELNALREIMNTLASTEDPVLGMTVPDPDQPDDPDALGPLAMSFQHCLARKYSTLNKCAGIIGHGLEQIRASSGAYSLDAVAEAAGRYPLRPSRAVQAAREVRSLPRVVADVGFDFAPRQVALEHGVTLAQLDDASRAAIHSYLFRLMKSEALSDPTDWRAVDGNWVTVHYHRDRPPIAIGLSKDEVPVIVAKDCPPGLHSDAVLFAVFEGGRYVIDGRLSATSVHFMGGKPADHTVTGAVQTLAVHSVSMQAVLASLVGLGFRPTGSTHEIRPGGPCSIASRFEISLGSERLELTLFDDTVSLGSSRGARTLGLGAVVQFLEGLAGMAPQDAVGAARGLWG
ncbi:hypothetical protein J8273_7889 [Carpediemonas membranifera]|uniref:Uncharacterized protein n=1 Tax=Carpediemonas membranifera TaxID=201153 RepID=A0A8J6AQ50_9EUKA|nr:hypothetical protein J8273_7889 [Carpediemonas membranifera]|eukprot:KAG9390538.1 hypothetical protein J8273_7889 [Carpediemonas membranifera]